MKIRQLQVIPGVGMQLIVTKTRTLYDAQGNAIEIPDGTEPMPVGINDFAADPRNPTPEEHELAKQKISERFRAVMKADDAELVAETLRLNGVIQVERTAKEAALAERDNERRAKEAALAERDNERRAKEAALAELATEKAKAKTERR